MNVDIHWEDAAKTIIRYTYAGEWDWDEFYRILEWRDADLLRGVKINVIVDFRDVTHFPSDAVLHLKRAAKMVNDTHDMIILIARSSSLITLFNMFIRMYSFTGKRLHMVTSDEEAYALLKIPSKSL